MISERLFDDPFLVRWQRIIPSPARFVRKYFLGYDALDRTRRYRYFRQRKTNNRSLTARVARRLRSKLLEVIELINLIVLMAINFDG